MTWDWLNTAGELQKQGVLFAIVTVIKTNGSTPREAGTKMLVTVDDLHGTVGGGRLEAVAVERARNCLQQGKNEFFEMIPEQEQSCGGHSSLFIELVGNSGPKLVVFGAGHVGQAVAELALKTPFAVSLVDSREEWLAKAPHDVMVRSDPDQLMADTLWSENHYVVIMTHSHGEDYRILQEMVAHNIKYLGVIGGKPKWNSFQKQLREQQVSESVIQRITCPIGLKIGGKSPAEVAISLMAELISIYYGNNE